MKRFAAYRVLSLFLVFLTFGSVSAHALSLPQAVYAALDSVPRRKRLCRSVRRS